VAACVVNLLVAINVNKASVGENVCKSGNRSVCACALDVHK